MTEGRTCAVASIRGLPNRLVVLGLIVLGGLGTHDLTLGAQSAAQPTELLDRICTYLERDNPNQQAAARRQLREEIGLGEISELRAYLGRRLPMASLEELTGRLQELLAGKLTEVETHILAFEASRRLAREQAADDRRESTEDTRERLEQIRVTRSQAYERAHAGFEFLVGQGVSLAPALWHHRERGGDLSGGVRRFRERLWERVTEEARRSFPSAPREGSISPFVERSLVPLVATLEPSDPGGWEAFRERVATGALERWSRFTPADRQQGRSIFLELDAWGVERLETWAQHAQSAVPRELRQRYAQWNRLGVPVGFVDHTGLDPAHYSTRSLTERQELLYRLEWVGDKGALPIFARLLFLEEDLSLKVECAAALARLGDPRGGEFLRQLGLAGVLSVVGISRDVLLIEALRRREQGDHEGALNDLQEILRRFGPDYRVHYEIGLTALRSGDYTRSIHHFQEAVQLSPGNDNALYNLACAHAMAGQADEAFAALERSIAAGFTDIDHMRTDPDLESIRNDPRFEKLIEQIKGQEGG